jgi:LCP family protein required for cell wall assembly
VTAGDRVNVLLLGIDKREGEQGPFRTDTMIVATLDPKTKTAAMLSIPRDLYVPIPAPGAGENRINTANFYGDETKYPGGGPALAEKTVEYNLAIPLHFYVLIDFSGFRKIIDTLGGIDVDVPVAIDDDQYPTEDYGIKTIHIPAGHIHMNGELALEYARSRHTTNDFDRSRRQMQILIAARNKALQINALTKLPQLIAQLKDSVVTDMTPQEILALAPIAAQVRPDNVKTRAIDQTMTYEIRLGNGADVLWPDRQKIGAVINEVFPPTIVDPLKQEAARIIVLNGTPSDGFAARAAQQLKANGLNVVQVANADRLDHTQTMITEYGDKPATLAELVKTFGVKANNIQKTAATGTADFRVIIGADWTPPQ